MSQERYPATPQDRAPAPATAGAGRFFRPLLWGLPVAWGALLGGAADPEAPAGVRTAQLVAPATLEYRDGPPPGFSGGFGESTCAGCHSERDVNEPGGKVVLDGVPERFTAGKVYPLTVTLTRGGMAVGGFELTARFEEGGAQAGALAAPPDAQGRVSVATDRDVQYAYQRQAGSQLVSPDTAKWTVLWTAPAQGGPVQFNVAANAANLDETTSGDFIYATVAKSNPPR